MNPYENLSDLNLEPEWKPDWVSKMKKLRDRIKHKYSTGKWLKYFKFKHRPAR